MTIHSFSHFAQRGQTVAGVRVWPFKAMHGVDTTSTFYSENWLPFMWPTLILIFPKDFISSGENLPRDI